MMKKILPIVLCLCLVFGISASATNPTDSTNTETSTTTEEMPMQGRGGGRGGMGGMGGNAPSGEMPTMPEGQMPTRPEGQMPFGEMTPPDNGGTAGTENTAEQQPSNAENTEENAPQENTDFFSGMPENGMFTRGQMRQDMQAVGSQETTTPTGILGFMQTYATPITSVLLLLAAFVFVFFYKRKRY